VGRKTRAPWLTPVAEVNPESIAPGIRLGCEKSFGGGYFDPETRFLYVAAPRADASHMGLNLPLIHVFNLA
jgi:hypothetical protein